MALIRSVWPLLPRAARRAARDALERWSSDDEGGRASNEAAVVGGGAVWDGGFTLPPEEAPEPGGPQRWPGRKHVSILCADDKDGLFKGRCVSEKGRFKLVSIAADGVDVEVAIKVSGEADKAVTWESGEAQIPDDFRNRPALALHFEEGCNPARVRVAMIPANGRIEDRILPVTESDRNDVSASNDLCVFEFDKMLLCKCASTAEWRPSAREIRLKLRVEATGDSFAEYVWLTHGILGGQSGWRAALIDPDLVKLEKPGDPGLDAAEEWTEWEEVLASK